MTMPVRFLAGLSGLALTLAGCAAQPMDDTVYSAQTPASAAPVKVVETDSAAMLDRADADPALWKVSDADTTIYLFGTMHALKKDLVWFDDAVKDAFDSSDELVIEMLDPDPATMQPVMQGAAMRADGTLLSSDLTAEQQAKLAEATAKLGIPVTALEPMQPWFAAVQLAVVSMTKLGFGADAGAESILKKAAKARGIEVSGLETFEQQMGFFSGLSSEDQVEFLMAGVEQIDEMDQMFLDMERYWGTGNVEKTAELLQDGMDESPELFEVLLAGRNRAWAEWIDTRLDSPGTVFVAVGAGHLAGKDSVQDALRARDIQTVRVPY